MFGPNVTPDTYGRAFGHRAAQRTPGVRLAPLAPQAMFPAPANSTLPTTPDFAALIRTLVANQSPSDADSVLSSDDETTRGATRNRSRAASGTRDIDLVGFTTDQLQSLTPYGAMLGRMSAAQIEGLLSKTTGSTPDGRALFASRPAPKRNFLDPQRKFVQSPGGDRLYY